MFISQFPQRIATIYVTIMIYRSNKMIKKSASCIKNMLPPFYKTSPVATFYIGFLSSDVEHMKPWVLSNVSHLLINKDLVH